MWIKIEYRLLYLWKYCFYKVFRGRGFWVRNRYVILGMMNLGWGWCKNFVEVCYSSFFLFMLWYIFDRVERFIGCDIRGIFDLKIRGGILEFFFIDLFFIKVEFIIVFVILELILLILIVFFGFFFNLDFFVIVDFFIIIFIF